MKRVLLIILALIMVLSLVSCSEYKETYEATYSSIQAEQEIAAINNAKFRGCFVSVADAGAGFHIYRDTVTDVLYVWHVGSYKGGLTVMLGTDGLPMTYEKYIELVEEVK